MNESLHHTAAHNAPSHSQEAAHVPETPSAVPETAQAAPASAPVSETGTDQQRAFLLQQLADAPDRQLPRGLANRKITKIVAKTLGLDTTTADQVRAALAAEGSIRLTRRGDAVLYELTEAGAARLQTLGPVSLPSSRGLVTRASSPAVEEGRKPYLLLQLFAAEGRTLAQKEANRFDAVGRQALELNATTADQLRRQLAEQGLLTIHKQDGSETYTLTRQGRLHLGAMKPFFEGTAEIRLSGKVLNELMEAAREAAREFEGPAATHEMAAEERPGPQEEDLAGASYEASASH